VKQLLISMAVLLVALGGSVSALTPSEALISVGQTPAMGVVSLQHANWSILNSSAFAMAPLGSSHYVWDTSHVKQNNTPTEGALKSWSDVIVPLPPNIQEV
jgi:hypothetical protein